MRPARLRGLSMVSLAATALVPGAAHPQAIRIGECGATCDCDTPLVCTLERVCDRPRCERAEDCRSPAKDVCIRGLCYGPGDPPDLRAAALGYEESEKSRAAAVGVGLLVPGAGSFYAHDWWGFLPLAGAAGGAGLIATAFLNPPPSALVTNAPSPSLLSAGLMISVIAWVAGAALAVRSVRIHNEALWAETIGSVGRTRRDEYFARPLTIGVGSLVVRW